MLPIPVWVHVFDTYGGLSITDVHWCVLQPTRLGHSPPTTGAKQKHEGLHRFNRLFFKSLFAYSLLHSICVLDSLVFSRVIVLA